MPPAVEPVPPPISISRMRTSQPRLFHAATLVVSKPVVVSALTAWNRAVRSAAAACGADRRVTPNNKMPPASGNSHAVKRISPLRSTARQSPRQSTYPVRKFIDPSSIKTMITASISGLFQKPMDSTRVENPPVEMAQQA